MNSKIEVASTNKILLLQKRGKKNVKDFNFLKISVNSSPFTDKKIPNKIYDDVFKIFHVTFFVEHTEYFNVLYFWAQRLLKLYKKTEIEYAYEYSNINIKYI
jgi:hypothetical protein